MAYKAKATRNDDGSYTLSYGKGSKKLTADLHHEDVGWVIITSKGDSVLYSREAVKTKREAIAAWSDWAASAYEGGTSAPASPGQTVTTSHDDASPSPHSGPPRYKPKAADDELNDNERAFFATLAEKRGDLTEWQRGQARNLLGRIGWPNRSRQETNNELAKSRGQGTGGSGERAQCDRPQVGDAPAAQDAAPASPAGSEQAASADDRATQNASLPPIPRRPKPLPVVPQSGGAAQPAGA